MAWVTPEGLIDFVPAGSAGLGDDDAVYFSDGRLYERVTITLKNPGAVVMRGVLCEPGRSARRRALRGAIGLNVSDIIPVQRRSASRDI